MNIGVIRYLLTAAFLLCATAAQAASTQTDFDTAFAAAQTAINQAKQAEALAKASIAQSKEQDTAWKAGVIH
jgi:hypothetical protein